MDRVIDSYPGPANTYSYTFKNSKEYRAYCGEELSDICPELVTQHKQNKESLK